MREFIRKAVEASPVEADIIRKVIEALEAAGNPVVSVWDGEERVEARGEEEIFEQVFNLDEATLITLTGAGVSLVMGEGEDVIADFNVSLEDVLDPIIDEIINA